MHWNPITILLCYNIIYSEASDSLILDILEPYSIWPLNNRQKRSIDDDPYELYSLDYSKSVQNFNLRYFAKTFAKQWISGHHVIIPVSSVSIIPPAGNLKGCENKERATVEYASNIYNCKYAVNAGFFNITDGSCLGYVVSNGAIIHDFSNLNVHFGITKNNSIFIGYLSQKFKKEDFQQLVGGVIWVVRNSKNFVQESIARESPETQTTGSLEMFAKLPSARTCIGFDSNGNIHIIQVDGKTFTAGINLFDMADLLISFGVENAINLDGGGSATSILHNLLINYPSDRRIIDKMEYSQARNVSTVVCVAYNPCKEANCSGHGTCIKGVCKCEGKWSGEFCQVPFCPEQHCVGGACHLDQCYNNSVLTEKTNIIISPTEKIIWIATMIFLLVTSTISLFINCFCRRMTVASNAHKEDYNKVSRPLISSDSSEDDELYSRRKHELLTLNTL